MAKNRPTHISKPVYPGGMTALRKFVAKHLKYPETALKERVEGTVTVRYSLDYRGKVVDAKVKKGLGHGCDEEAVRVVKLLRFEVPQSRKKKVRIHQDLNVHFKLPKQTRKPAARTPTAPASAPTVAGRVTVRYVPTKTAAKETTPSGPQKKGTSFTYTVTIK